MSTKSHPRAKSRGTWRHPNQRETACKNGSARCKQGKPSSDSKTEELRELRATLLNTFLQRRDHSSCSKEAHAVLDAMAESVDNIPRDILRVYLALIETSASSTEIHGTLSTAEKELMTRVRDGTYEPADAHCYVLNVLRFTLDDSALWTAALANPDLDQGWVQDFCSTLLTMCDEIERADRVAVTGETLH
jgi:hypothetical protein